MATIPQTCITILSVGCPTSTITCTAYINNTGNSYIVSFTDCNGNVYTNYEITPNDSICVQDGTLTGDYGYLTNLGQCSG